MSWATFATESPDLAAKVRARFEAHPHHIIATIRADGSPRVSGSNVEFTERDPVELRIGSMGGAVKALDLMRDPRYALHSAPLDEQLNGGDAKVSGVVTLVESPPEDPESHAFVLEVLEASLVEVDGEQLKITSWSPDAGTRVRRRS